MFPSYIGMINNASFGIMNNCESMTSMMRNGSMGSSSILKAEKGLQMDNLNKSLEYSAYGLMEDSAKKLRNDNIKRSFSTFA